MSFEGFPPGMPLFFEELEVHNERGWWKANAARYRAEVEEPTAELVACLEPEFGPIRRFRPYRDVRFSRDKRPYQEHVSFATERTGGALYARFGAHGALIAGGLRQPSPAELARFRELVDDVRSVEDVEEVLADRERDGLHPDDDAALATAPRGYARDHPRIALLRRTRLTVAASLDAGPWLTTPEVLATVERLWRSADVWNAWLDANVLPMVGGASIRA